ncbi:MAG: isochorismatase family protein [Acidobacteria bacterium]|nr:isochorismatase family protein [Acidobacteriota bacterium]
MLLIDEDTQLDFLLPAGALYVPGAEKLIPTLARIFEGARERGVPILSSVDAHAENDPEFADWPAHCVAGTLGQQKVPATLLRDRAVVPNRPGIALPDHRIPQVIVEKQTLDVFSNPNLLRLLDRYPNEECAVLGVATDYCVRYAIEGLLNAGRKVRIITDAICGIDPAASEQVLSRAIDRGAKLTTSRELWP